MKSIHKLTLSLLIEKYSNESQLSNKIIELFEKLETFQVNIEDVLLAWELKETPHVLELPESKKEEQPKIIQASKPANWIPIENLPTLHVVSLDENTSKLRIIKEILEFGKKIEQEINLKQAKEFFDEIVEYTNKPSLGKMVSEGSFDIMRVFKDKIRSQVNITEYVPKTMPDKHFVKTQQLMLEHMADLRYELNHAGLKTTIFT